MKVALFALTHVVLIVALTSNASANDSAVNSNSTASSGSVSASSASTAGSSVASKSAASSVAAVSSDSHTYSAAYQQTQDSGKPLVILVGASWCPACQGMKTSTMPAVASKGELQHVAFAYVNVDAEHDLAGKLMEGGLIPQLVMYEKAGDSWTMKRLVGAQSVEAVEAFLGPAAKQDVAVKQDAAKQPVAGKTQPAEKSPAAAANAVKSPAATQQSSAGQKSMPTG